MRIKRLNTGLLLLCVGFTVIAELIAKEIDWAFVAAIWVLYVMFHKEV